MSRPVNRQMQRGPDILIDAYRLVSAPDEAAAKEGREENDAVVPLVFGAGEVQLVQEPVNV
jgi:hypothetical protein